jgi:hypothetical protein
MSGSRSAVLCLAALGVFCAVTHAGPITFIASGALQDTSVLSGTVTIDTTLGTVTALNLSLSSPDSVTVSTAAAFGPSGISGVLEIVGSNGGSFPDLTLLVPTASFVGYTGGGLCIVGSVSCMNDPSFFLTGPSIGSSFTTLSLTESGVPEPASMALVGGGVLALAAFRRRKLARV